MPTPSQYTSGGGTIAPHGFPAGTGGVTGGGNIGWGSNVNDTPFTPSQQAETIIYLFEGAIQYPPMQELMAPSIGQIYTLADYEPFFQPLGGMVSSAILVPSAANFQDGITLFVFNEAGFQGGFVSYYMDSRHYASPERYIDFFGQVIGGYGTGQSPSAMLVQQENALIQGMSLMSYANETGLQNTIQGTLATQGSASARNGLRMISLIGNLNFQFTMNRPGFYGQDLIRIELPVEVEFAVFDLPATLTGSLYIFVQLILANNVLNIKIVDTDVSNFVQPGSFEIELAERVVSNIIKKHLHNNISNFQKIINPINLSNKQGITFNSVYTVPWVPALGAQSYNSGLSNSLVEYTGIKGLQGGNVTFDYSSPTQNTDILICLN